GAFQSKVVIAIVAFTGVALASVYSLRLFIRTMHNRLGPKATSREIGLAEGLIVAPLVAVIIAFALYPQFALRRSELTVKASIRDAKVLSAPPREASR